MKQRKHKKIKRIQKEYEVTLLKDIYMRDIIELSARLLRGQADQKDIEGLAAHYHLTPEQVRDSLPPMFFPTLQPGPGLRA